MKTTKLFSALVSGAAILPMSAAVTYVDATVGNTVGAASGLVDWNDGSAGTGDGTANSDGLWRYRGGFGGNGLWEATGSQAQIENAEEIVTSVTGLANGTYNAYVFFVAVEAPNGVSGGDEEFPIRAGLISDPGANPIFTQVISTETPGATVGIDASTLSFANTFIPGTATDGRTNYAGFVGEAVVTDGTLSVFVDDLPAVNDADERTWYTGIGYELIPEPSTSLLGALGALALIGRRRR